MAAVQTCLCAGQLQRAEEGVKVSCGIYSGSR